ncbi:DUF2637 domain-containing protein [Isoptericola sp. QY 916]|uniref:DUF2637 domain-containing protein n=1 Tax=Isoptericola sp. QY 916 TaxID=2782570 RepID=UPI003D2FCF28|nr:DUF2637 domain-containing protein [Isoptericola sp. QY 916]
MSSHRLNPDSRPVLWTIATGTTIVFLASFALSSVALYDVAGWAHVPHGLAWAVPVMLDVALVVYSLSALVRRARGRSAWFSWCLLGAFTLVSLLGNAAHSLGIPQPAQPLVGTVVVALAPVAALAALENLAGLIIARPDARVAPATGEPSTEHSAVILELHTAEAEELDILGTLESTHPRTKRTRENLATILNMQRRGARQHEIADALGMSTTLVKTALRDMQAVGLVRGRSRG